MQKASPLAATLDCRFCATVPASASAPPPRGNDRLRHPVFLGIREDKKASELFARKQAKNWGLKRRPQIVKSLFCLDLSRKFKLLRELVRPTLTKKVAHEYLYTSDSDSDRDDLDTAAECDSDTKLNLVFFV